MKKNYTLKRELTFLMILTSVCTLLSVCAAVFYVFFSFFFQKTQEDIEYVLRYTSQQYEDHMQFIEDSVIAIRHNTVLDDFFQKEEYDLEEIEPQLSYSMELFSERNMVELLLLEFICLIMGMNVFMSTIMPPHWLPGENRSENTKTCSRNLKVPVTSTPVCLIKMN